MRSGLAVGFDLDGVLLDSEHLVEGTWLHTAFAGTLRRFRIPVTDENVRALFVVRYRTGGAAFAARFGVDPEALWAERDRAYIARKLAALESGEIQPFADAEAVAPLAERYALGIVSNSPQVVVDRVVHKFGWQKWFRVAIGRGSALADLPVTKPAPDLLLRFLREIKAERGYYVGDQPEDAQAARAAGLTPIVLDRGDGGDAATLADLPALIERRERGL